MQGCRHRHQGTATAGGHFRPLTGGRLSIAHTWNGSSVQPQRPTSLPMSTAPNIPNCIGLLGPLTPSFSMKPADSAGVSTSCQPLCWLLVQPLEHKLCVLLALWPPLPRAALDMQLVLNERQQSQTELRLMKLNRGKLE